MTIQKALDEAQRSGCDTLTASELMKGLLKWLSNQRQEIERFGEAAGPPSWNLILRDSWDGEVPCSCVFETLLVDGDVELSFYVIAKNSRDVINWCENSPGDVDEARAEFAARWGAPYARITLKASSLAAVSRRE